MMTSHDCKPGATPGTHLIAQTIAAQNRDMHHPNFRREQTVKLSRGAKLRTHPGDIPQECRDVTRSICSYQPGVIHPG